jgi:hypothetical protein
MRFIGAYTCNRCIEERDIGKAPQDVPVGIGTSPTEPEETKEP